MFVKISKPQDDYITHGCGLPYPLLYFHTNKGDNFDLYPAFYIKEKGSRTGNPTFEVRYIEDVVEVNVEGTEYFFKSKSLFDWLESDGWKKDFDVT